MFSINKERIFKSDFPLIVEAYEVLHFDDEPILFTGLNKSGSRVLGSSVEEDTENKIQRYFHVFVSQKHYSQFYHGLITYLDILNASSEIFVIDETFDRTRKLLYLVPFEEIPSDYLPTQDSYYPHPMNESSFEYDVKLVGGIADTHRATSPELNIIQSAFTNTLNRATALFSKYFSSRVFQGVQFAGSYGLSFQLELVEKEVLTIGADREKYALFVKRLIEYCLYHVYDDMKTFSSVAGISAVIAPKFGEVLKSYEEIMGSYGHQKDSQIVDEMLNIVRGCVEEFSKMSSITGRNFSEVEVYNSLATSKELIGVIAEDYTPQANVVIDIIESILDKLIVDEFPKEYEIVVYHLNLETRVGNAFMNAFNDEERVCRPKIKISGTDPLEGSIFTESLHFGKKIKVKAIAKRKDHFYKKLAIEFK